MTRFGAVDQ